MAGTTTTRGRRNISGTFVVKARTKTAMPDVMVNIRVVLWSWIFWSASSRRESYSARRALLAA
ncbi:hypothetical protein [Adlercreutzia sp. ZJ242]|uniref:hypothetical protein n=1 Tax=Adlercreutzia sp. ZJ242 TaxID=2709409 RepID=UPI00197EF03A|nr:hypothetical protein [Adlercreutzia sp. ZJ242]